MSLLRDYVITPDVFVFNKDVYKSEEVYDLYMEKIFDVISNHGVIRNLRAGKWGKEIKRNLHRCTDRTRRRIRSLKGREFPFAPASSKAPTKAKDWVDEAFESHRKMGLTGGIITSIKPTRDDYDKGPIKYIHDLKSHPDGKSDTYWWPSYGDSSICLERTSDSYKENLLSVVHYSSSLKLIDPYVNLLEEGSFVDTFLNDVLSDSTRKNSLRVQIHSSVKMLNGEMTTRKYIQQSCNKLTCMLRDSKVERVEVFIWKNFHDRYLLSNLIGICLAHGFATTERNSLKTTWGRIGRESREYIRDAFNPELRPAALIDSATITLDSNADT